MEKHIRIATFITNLMDRKFGIGKFRFGLDPLIGFIPGIGDVITLLFASYLVWIGLQMKLPEKQIALMIRNIAVDFVMGLIPFLGDFVDFVFKANTRNLQILQKHMKKDIIEGEVVVEKMLLS